MNAYTYTHIRASNKHGWQEIDVDAHEWTAACALRWKHDTILASPPSVLVEIRLPLLEIGVICGGCVYKLAQCKYGLQTAHSSGEMYTHMH